MKILLQDMTWEEVEEARKMNGGVALVPVGSTEQHGKHLPLGSDSFCAIAVTEDVATRTGSVVAPPLWYGWSPHHMWLPGTISLRPSILTELVVDICKSLVAHDFRRIVVVNGHRYANLPPLQEATWMVRMETKADVRLVDLMLIGDTVSRELGLDPLGHGDEEETSHMLHIKPELVRMDKARKWLPPYEQFGINDIRVIGDRVVWVPHPSLEGRDRELRKEISGGISGDPTKATKIKGERFHNAVVENIVHLIESMKRT